MTFEAYLSEKHGGADTLGRNFQRAGSAGGRGVGPGGGDLGEFTFGKRWVNEISRQR